MNLQPDFLGQEKLKYILQKDAFLNTKQIKLHQIWHDKYTKCLFLVKYKYAWLQFQPCMWSRITKTFLGAV